MFQLDNPEVTVSHSLKDDSTPSSPRTFISCRDELAPDTHQVKLSWRSWMVVFVTCFAIMAQVYVVVAAGSVIAFIIRDIGEPSLAGWVIQGPLLMQAVLSPIMGRLSDVLERKYITCMPPLIAFVGAIMSAKAQSMIVLIVGGIFIGITLSTVGIVQAISVEVLPMKYRALGNGFAFVAGSLGGLTGVLGAGGLTNDSPSGWRGIFWLQAAFHLATALGLLAFYHPKPVDRPKLSFSTIIWACDPIGSVLFVASATLMLLALDWAGASYSWNNLHVALPLGLGSVLLALFCLYEWKGRADGIVAHQFFRGSPNFALSIFAFAVEGWIFYGAVNSITPQIVLNLGFESSSWTISVRQLSFNLVNIFASIPITWYATAYKDLKNPLLVTYTLFLIVSICYAAITPSMNNTQIGFNILSGIGQAGPLTLLVALIQFTAPHAFLSTATGLAFSARAIGGAFGSAILNLIINKKLASTYGPAISSAAVKAGLPPTSLSALLTAFASGSPDAMTAVPGITVGVIQASVKASELTYAQAYRLAWASIIPFVVLATIAVASLKGVKDLMTETVEATVEKTAMAEKEI